MSTNTIRDNPPADPKSDLTRVSESVVIEWGDCLYVWHWCAHVGQGAVDSRWVRSGTKLHDVTYGPEGVTFNPSVYWNECCGLHGWIRNDAWIPA